MKDYHSLKLLELREIAKEKGVKSPYKYRKKDLIQVLEDLGEEEACDDRTPSSEEEGEKEKEKEREKDKEKDKEKVRKDLPSTTGHLEVMPDGYGFLRTEGDQGEKQDYYMPAAHIKRFSLKSGDIVSGVVGDIRERDKYAPIIYINTVNGTSPIEYSNRSDFDDLTPIYADERFRLEQGQGDLANRIMDLVAPIGKGQRGLIVSPPKAGKTTLLKSIAHAIENKYPEVFLFILLIDERPEEVTDFERSVNINRSPDDPVRTEVIASTFDKMAQNHIETAEKLLDRTKRLVESGQDVFILLDSLTRLSRAYNITTTPSGRTLSGGLDPVALYPPKAFFGAARNIDGAGSMTILATCLTDTGSRMDDMIYEEFKGTGNMEVHLSRELAELRIFPAIDIFASGTRRDDLLMEDWEEKAIFRIRRQGRQGDPIEMIDQLIRLIRNTPSNREFCDLIQQKYTN